MTSKCCRDKAVVVVVYAEKPQRGSRGDSHHDQFHHGVSTNPKSSKGKGYNRRAELLDYARKHRKPAIQSLSSLNIIQPSTTQVLGGDVTRKQKHSSSPKCFGKWNFGVKMYVRRTKHKEKIKNKNKVSKIKKALVKSLQVHKKKSFLSKLLAAIQKRH